MLLKGFSTNNFYFSPALPTGTNLVETPPCPKLCPHRSSQNSHVLCSPATRPVFQFHWLYSIPSHHIFTTDVQISSEDLDCVAIRVQIDTRFRTFRLWWFNFARTNAHHRARAGLENLCEWLQGCFSWIIINAPISTRDIPGKWLTRTTGAVDGLTRDAVGFSSSDFKNCVQVGGNSVMLFIYFLLFVFALAHNIHVRMWAIIDGKKKQRNGSKEINFFGFDTTFTFVCEQYTLKKKTNASKEINDII